MVISPPLGRSRVAIMLRIVLFPQPDGPSNATNSPFRIANDTSLTACIADPWKGKDLLRCCTSIRIIAASGRVGLLRLKDEVGHDDIVHRDRLDAGQLAEPQL